MTLPIYNRYKKKSIVYNETKKWEYRRSAIFLELLKIVIQKWSGNARAPAGPIGWVVFRFFFWFMFAHLHVIVDGSISIQSFRSFLGLLLLLFVRILDSYAIESQKTSLDSLRAIDQNSAPNSISINLFSPFFFFTKLRLLRICKERIVVFCACASPEPNGMILERDEMLKWMYEKSSFQSNN